ncbi:MAG: hypothetical protein IPN33_24610 [Saprospiraceae bacterium]|nr:hypothetical protein [Saprospiraceae bacterium]
MAANSCYSCQVTMFCFQTRIRRTIFVAPGRIVAQNDLYHGKKWRKVNADFPANPYIASVNAAVMAWGIVAVFFLILFATLLWLPLVLEIDSEKDIYRVRWSRVIDFKDDSG